MPGGPDPVAAFTPLRAELIGLAYRMTGSWATAEDIAQEAFVQLVRHWSKVSRYDEPGAWLRRVAIRMAVKETRRARLRPVRELQSQPPPVGEPEVSDPALLAAVRELSPRQRAVVALFYLEDRPMDEVAELLRRDRPR